MKGSYAAFDQLPLHVKALLWDGMESWACQPILKTVNKVGAWKAAEDILRWDAEERGRRALWMRKRPVGRKNRTLPKTPSEAAQVDQLRSYRHLYRSAEVRGRLPYVEAAP